MNIRYKINTNYTVEITIENYPICLDIKNINSYAYRNGLHNIKSKMLGKKIFLHYISAWPDLENTSNAVVNLLGEVNRKRGVR